MILSILQGSTFLNKLKVSDENYHILYLNLENSEYTLDRLLKCQLSEYELNETQLERLFIPDCMAMTFDNRKDVASISRWIDELHIEIVVVDPILDSFVGDQNDLTIVKSVIRKMREINSKISWVMIHHFKKGNDEDSLINLMLGSVGFANASTSIIGLRRYSKSVNPMYKKIEFGKTRDFEQPDEIKVALNPITRIFEVVGDIDKFQPMTDDCVLDAFEENEKLTHTILVTRVEMSMGISEKQARILITKALASHKIKA
jgi:hypothetical protein